MNNFVRASTVVFLIGGLNVQAADVAKNVQSTEDWERREILLSPEELNESVIESKALGEWQSDGFIGTLVFQITQTKLGTNKLYVQWVDKASNEVSYSISVREFNVHPEYQFDLPVCGNDSCTFSKINAVHAFEEIEQVFTLNLVGLGRYRVGLLDK